ncbi:MAG TPA: FkbM family methyltransferase [Planctomycetaceae bacterium]|nr:FkbM family methyltransferase [Planctomycetaceae bacterium]HRA88451.1 FkbM family methyltransferase [Planctomycetaceae bacterium]
MLKTLKSIANSNPFFRQVAIAARSVLRPTTNDLLRRLVRAAAKHVDRPVFVKVGANDGVTGDPFGDSLLNNRQWKGVLVEPVPYCVDRLRRIYSDKTRFTIDQSAVGSTAGTAKFYYVAEAAKKSLPDLPEWYDQLGSFDRQHIIDHFGGKIESFIVTADVDVEPLSNIFQRYQLSCVTLLHIDTEGYDLKVLKSLGLPGLCPSWIMIEHRHLSGLDRTEMISILDSAGYDISDTGFDFFAMHRKTNCGLHRTGRVGRIFNRETIAPSR